MPFFQRLLRQVIGLPYETPPPPPPPYHPRSYTSNLAEGLADNITTFAGNIRGLKNYWEGVLIESNRLPNDAKPDLRTPFDMYLDFVRIAHSNATIARSSVLQSFTESVLGSAQNSQLSVGDTRIEAERFWESLSRLQWLEWTRQSDVIAAIERAVTNLEQSALRFPARGNEIRSLVPKVRELAEQMEIIAPRLSYIRQVSEMADQTVSLWVQFLRSSDVGKRFWPNARQLESASQKYVPIFAALTEFVSA